MAKIFYKRIKAGIMTIDDVPGLWKSAVQKMLDADKKQEDQSRRLG